MSWKDAVCGYMERGTTFGVPGLNVKFPPPPTSHMSWGLVFISGDNMTSTIPLNSIIDTIDENTV